MYTDRQGDQDGGYGPLTEEGEQDYSCIQNKSHHGRRCEEIPIQQGCEDLEGSKINQIEKKFSKS